MSLIDLIQDKAWALTPAKLDEINAFLDARIADPSFSVEIARGKNGNKAEERFEVRDGVAIIPVHGVLDKRANMFMEISGGTSTQLLQRDIKSALGDPAVDSILLDVDSPGGAVDGTKELADFIVESRGQKPIVAFANGMMASAAYWIGSAADAIVANDTAIVGSIGVALTHYDRSAQDEKLGIKRTMIYAGKYKRIASDEKPLTEEGQEYLQGIVDTYYTIFVESVAENRGMETEKVIKKMADGRDFIGKQAKRAGLVDYIGSFDSALQMVREKGRKKMTLKELQEKYPDLYQEVFDVVKAAASTPEIVAEARQQGITEERARVTTILEADGDPAMTMQAVKDGTEAETVGWLFFKAEKANRDKGLKTLETTQPESVGHGAKETEASGKGDYMKLVEAYRKEKKCGLGQAMSDVAKQQPEIHQAWLASQQ